MAESVPNATSSADLPDDKPAPGLPTSFEFPSNLPQPPFINISGLPNFRDIGGYLTAASYLSSAGISNTKPTMVRRNLIYRCAHPQLLTPEGNTQLTKDYNVKHIFDLRSGTEVRKLSASLPSTSSTDAPTNPRSLALQPVGIERHFTPIYETEEYSPTAIANKVAWYTATQSNNSKLPYPYSEGFVSAYRDIALYGTISENSCPSHNAAAYPTILRQIIAHPNEPIIYHCTAGKDRTGVLTALLFRLAGVDDETIGWEYALTEPGLGSWRDLFIERISKTGMGGASQPEQTDKSTHPSTTSDEIKQLKPSMTRSEASRIVGARAGNMRAFLTLVLDGEFGGVEKYMTERCGLSREDVETLRGILVVEVERVEDVVPMMAIRIKGWSADGGVVDGQMEREREEGVTG